MAYFEKDFYVSKDDTKILSLLKPRSGVVRAVLDTDTFNEIDDQFALVQMMLSHERIKVEGIYAAPFSMNERADTPEKGMELSYDEILRLLERINVSHENFVFKGVKEYVGSNKQVVEAPAVDELIKIAKAKILTGSESAEAMLGEELGAEKMKAAAQAKKLAIMDALEILKQMEALENEIKEIKENGGKQNESNSDAGFAEKRARK